MSNSKLISHTNLSPNCTSPRTSKITKITPHHMAGNLSIESCLASFVPTSRGASCNYAIGTDGRIGLGVDEENRSWCSSSRENDHQAITIEVANDGGEDENWHVSDEALAALIDLCVDICERNDIEKLNFTGDETGNLTMHQYFAATACPGPYLASKFQYIAEQVNERLSPTKTDIKDLGLSGQTISLNVISSNKNLDCEVSSSGNAIYIGVYQYAFMDAYEQDGAYYTDETLSEAKQAYKNARISEIANKTIELDITDYSKNLTVTTDENGDGIYEGVYGYKFNEIYKKGDGTYDTKETLAVGKVNYRDMITPSLKNKEAIIDVSDHSKLLTGYVDSNGYIIYNGSYDYCFKNAYYKLDGTWVTSETKADGKENYKQVY